MIDVWLLFNLLKPFVDIIVQTYVETMREHPDEKEEETEGPRSAWVIPREGRKAKSESLEAMRYEVAVMTAITIHDCRLKSEMKQLERARNRVKIERARYFLRTIYPLFCIIFIILFWLLGLFHYWSHGSGSQEEDQAETSNH